MTPKRIRSCEDAIRHLAAHLDGELEQRTAEQLEQHLERCRSCYSRAEFERRLKASLAELGREPVPPALGRRVSELIGRFTATAE
jgi:anti-sigma factor (TIGR02949 family)